MKNLDRQILGEFYNFLCTLKEENRLYMDLTIAPRNVFDPYFCELI